MGRVACLFVSGVKGPLQRLHTEGKDRENLVSSGLQKVFTALKTHPIIEPLASPPKKLPARLWEKFSLLLSVIYFHVGSQSPAAHKQVCAINV